LRYEVRVADRAYRVDLDASGRFLVDGAAVAAVASEIVHGREWRISLDGASHDVVVLTREPLRLLVDGLEVSASAIDERALAASPNARQQASGRHELRAPMPGLLRAVHVREGDIVERDAPVVTLEAMKMENELRAPARARVTKLAAAAGAKVDGGAVIAVLSEVE
jgi:biotin carboxyl carrier protein